MNRIIVILFLLVASTCIAQDTLFLENGDTMVVKIVDVLDRELTYKEIDNPELITKSIEGELIKSILHEDGSKEKFSKQLPHYIGSSFIISAPLGVFQETSNPSTNGGNALGGVGLTLYGALYVLDKTALYIDLGVFRNQFDGTQIRNRLTNNLDSAGLSFSSTHWQTAYVVGGPQYSFTFGKRWTLDLRGLIGDYSTQKPQIELNYTDNNGTAYKFTSGSGKGNGLAWGGGIGLRFQFSKHLSIDYSYTYIRSKQVIDYADTLTETNSNGDISEEITPGIRTQTVVVANTRFGLTYTFNKR